jgi:transposase InsO family protein
MIKTYPLVMQNMSGKANGPKMHDLIGRSVGIIPWQKVFFRILKLELTQHMELTSRAVTRMTIFEFIEIWYNRKRIHASLGYLTPNEYEAKLNDYQ